MRFTALDATGDVLHREEFFSTGGGFIVRAGEFGRHYEGGPEVEVPHEFTSADELLARARERGLELHELMLENERAYRPDAETRAALMHLWAVMDGCISVGSTPTACCPVCSRCAAARHACSACWLEQSSQQRPLDAIEWVNAFALSVNEENAAGGRCRHGPHQRRRGHRAAVLAYYRKFEPGASEKRPSCASCWWPGAIGMLYKRNASISGAEMGLPRARSAWRARWRRRGWSRHSMAPTNRSKTQRRSAWSTTWD